jgi:hypothetical protein
MSNPTKNQAKPHSIDTRPPETLPTTIQTLTTPQIMRGGLIISWAVGLLFLTSTISAMRTQRGFIKMVGVDAAPSILNAQRIRDSLSDMDANAANELIAKPGQNPEAVASYNKRREKLSKLLVASAENITYGNQERVPISTIQFKVGDYFQLVQRARDFHAQGNQAEMLNAYRAAAEIMDKTLLPAAEELTKVNNSELNGAYQNQKVTATGSIVLVILAGLLMVGVLFSLQIFLDRRMKRVLNPGLLAASAIAVLFTVYTVSLLMTASSNLRIAKEDAFDSLYPLRKARALSYSANGDESRYLLDAQLAQQHEQNFFNKVKQVGQAPAGATLEMVANTAFDSSNPRQDSIFVGFEGYLADQLRNITFGEPEQKATAEAIRTFGKYLEIDKKIRALQTSGQRQAAIDLCIGNNPGESNWAFDQYKKTHQQVMNINMAEFQKAIQRSFRAVGVDAEYIVAVTPNPQTKEAEAANEDINILGMKEKVETGAITRYEMLSTIAIAAIALLTLVGIMPRLKEYTK